MPRHPVHELLATAAYEGREATQEELAQPPARSRAPRLVRKAARESAFAHAGGERGQLESTRASVPSRSWPACRRSSATPATSTTPTSRAPTTRANSPAAYPANRPEEATEMPPRGRTTVQETADEQARAKARERVARSARAGQAPCTAYSEADLTWAFAGAPEGPRSWRNSPPKRQPPRPSTARASSDRASSRPQPTGYWPSGPPRRRPSGGPRRRRKPGAGWAGGRASSRKRPRPLPPRGRARRHRPAALRCHRPAGRAPPRAAAARVGRHHGGHPRCSPGVPRGVRPTRQGPGARRAPHQQRPVGAAALPATSHDNSTTRPHAPQPCTHPLGGTPSSPSEKAAGLGSATACVLGLRFPGRAFGGGEST